MKILQMNKNQKSISQNMIFQKEILLLIGKIFYNLDLTLQTHKSMYLLLILKHILQCVFAIHNDFNNSSWGQGQTSNAQFNKKAMFTQYKPPEQFIQNVIRDYRPLQAMSVELQFGYLRIFEFYCVMQVFTKKPVTQDVGNTIIAKIKETLALYFAPANREIGILPTYQEIIDVSLTADTRIKYVDLGSIGVPNYGIIWKDCDIDCFNAISFARFKDPGTSSKNIRIHPECLVRQ